MNLRPLLCAAALLGALPLAPLVAQPAPPAPPAPPAAPAATAADEAIDTELGALVERVKAALAAGKTTPAELSEELAAFEALREKHLQNKSNASARIGAMHGMLYLQVFEQPEAALPILRRVIADFPETELARRLPDVIAQIEQSIVADAATAIGKEFAPFKETATDGRVVDLAAYRGKVVLIDFWATWCGPCVDELPHLKAAYEKYHAEGFEVIGISLDKDGDKLAAFTKKHALEWPQLFDGQGWQNKLAQAYGIRSIPATFLLDREGKIIAKGLRGTALATKVGEALAAKP